MTTIITQRDASMDKSIGLIDKSVIIQFRSLRTDVLPTEGTISAITVAELSIGWIEGKSRERINRQRLIQAAEAQFNVLPFDARSARIYADVYDSFYSTYRRGATRDSHDLMIAATALAHQLPLYTCHPRAFAGLDGLIEIVAV
jgi:predicted nucleic acid-binding protein